MVSIMTALYFEHLRAPDRVSVKPHASPVLHAIEYLLGALEPGYLTPLRQFGGLQSYPSRTKDPVPADFSTGSVGIGATAPIWSAIAHRYVAGHFEVPQGGRQVALLGDAELDEGAIWEALVDPIVPRLGEVLWVVDLNRQSLDRIVPDIAAGRIAAMFEAAGWHTVTVKYGRRLRELFERDLGRSCAPGSTRCPTRSTSGCCASGATELRERLPGDGSSRAGLAQLIAELDDEELLHAIRDLGGHDLGDLLDAFAAADAVTDRPSVIFAYTIKAWRLPTQGHPANHSALLSVGEWERLARSLGADAAIRGRAFAEGSPEAELCRAAAERLERDELPLRPPPTVPADVGRTHVGKASTQQAFGRFFVDLAHDAPDVAARVVTVSPDVASSTNLGGWINRVGIWHLGERIDWFADDTDTLVRWRETEHGQHIELGIAEGNLVGLLGELGATWSRDGQPLLPIGTHLRPVRQPRAGAVVVRDVRRRPVDPRRHAVGRDARARGRRAPVDHHAVGRARAAALHRLGARLRPGPRVDAAARALAARPPRRHLGLLPADDAADRPGAGGASRRSGAARAATPAGPRGRLSRCAGPAAGPR